MRHPNYIQTRQARLERTLTPKIDHCANIGDVVRIVNAEKDAEGVEKSREPMPSLYPGENRLSALQTLVPAEEDLIAKYERLLPLIADEDIKSQLNTHLSLKREHLFTQLHLLENAQKIEGLE